MCDYYSLMYNAQQTTNTGWPKKVHCCIASSKVHNLFGLFVISQGKV